MSAAAVAAWSAACLFVDLASTNPGYRGAVLAVELAVLAGAAGARRLRRPAAVAAAAALAAAAFNFVLSHLGATVLFELPAWLPALGGPYTVEALAFGGNSGLALAAAVLATTPLVLLLEPHDVLDALPAPLSRTGSAVAASLNLVPGIAAGFAAVGDAQRMRGWRPRGPRSWAEVFVPAVLTTIEGSIQLAESMEARGFGSGPRTHLRQPRLGRGGRAVVAASALAVALFAVARALGMAVDWEAYPQLPVPSLAAVPLAACLLLLAPLLTWRSLASRA